jgi:hypothetical protein
MNYLSNGKVYPNACDAYTASIVNLIDWYVTRYPHCKASLLDMLDDFIAGGRSISEDDCQRIVDPGAWGDDDKFDPVDWGEFV